MEKEELIRLINQNINGLVELRDYFERIDNLPFGITFQQEEALRVDLKLKIDVLAKQVSSFILEFDSVPMTRG